MKRTVLLAAFPACLAVAGCGSTRDSLDAMRPQVGGLVAQLRSPSSAVTGAVHVFDYRDGIQVQLSVANLIPGGYRIAFHERANCRSPNLFSAGDAWAPPSWAKPAGELLPAFIANQNGNEHGYVAFVKGVSVDGPVSLRDRSVVIHAGSMVGVAFPGQPNNRMACGVFEANKPFF